MSAATTVPQESTKGGNQNAKERETTRRAYHAEYKNLLFVRYGVVERQEMGWDELRGNGREGEGLMWFGETEGRRIKYAFENNQFTLA